MRGWEIFTRNRGKPKIEGLGFIMGGRFFNIVGRGVLTLLFHGNPHILPPSLFFNFSTPPTPHIPSNTPSCHLQPPSHCSFCFFVLTLSEQKKYVFLASNFLILASNRFSVPQFFYKQLKY